MPAPSACRFSVLKITSPICLERSGSLNIHQYSLSCDSVRDVLVAGHTTQGLNCALSKIAALTQSDLELTFCRRNSQIQSTAKACLNFKELLYVQDWVYTNLANYLEFKFSCVLPYARCLRGLNALLQSVRNGESSLFITDNRRRCISSRNWASFCPEPYKNLPR